VRVASCTRSADAESVAEEPYEVVVPYCKVETASSLVCHAMVTLEVPIVGSITSVITGGFVSAGGVTTTSAGRALVVNVSSGVIE